MKTLKSLLLAGGLASVLLSGCGDKVEEFDISKLSLISPKFDNTGSFFSRPQKKIGKTAEIYVSPKDEGYNAGIVEIDLYEDEKPMPIASKNWSLSNFITLVNLPSTTVADSCINSL